MRKQSYKVLWNVFLYVICGGSLIYGFVQNKKAVESRVENLKLERRIDSLKLQIQKGSEQLELALRQLQLEKDKAAESMRQSNKSYK